jgi:hypothetical protein
MTGAPFRPGTMARQYKDGSRRELRGGFDADDRTGPVFPGVLFDGLLGADVGYGAGVVGDGAVAHIGFRHALDGLPARAG